MEKLFAFSDKIQIVRGLSVIEIHVSCNHFCLPPICPPSKCPYFSILPFLALLPFLFSVLFYFLHLALSLCRRKIHRQRLTEGKVRQILERATRRTKGKTRRVRRQNRRLLLSLLHRNPRLRHQNLTILLLLSNLLLFLPRSQKLWRTMWPR